MSPRYYVLVKENGHWVECGEGPMTQKQAERISRELRQAGYPAKPISVDRYITQEVE